MFIMLIGIHPFDLEGGTSDVEILRRVANAEARILTAHTKVRKTFPHHLGLYISVSPSGPR